MILIFSLSSILFFIIFTLFIHWLINYLIEQHRIYHLLKEIPGPGIWESIKFASVVYGWSDKDPVGTKISKLVQNLCDTFGRETGIVKSWNGIFPPYIYICDAKLAKEILAHPDFQNKADIYRFLGRVVTGNGLLTCDGAHAHKYRLEFKKHFSAKSLESYVGNFQTNLKILDSKISQVVKTNDGVIEDIKPTISTLVLDSIGDNLFSTQFNSQTSQNGEPGFVTSIEYCLTQSDKLLLQQWRVSAKNIILATFCGFLDHALPVTFTIIKSVFVFKSSLLAITCNLYGKVFKKLSTSTSLKQTSNSKPSLMESIIEKRILSSSLPSSSKSSKLPSWLSWSPITFISGSNESFWHLSIFMLAGHQTSTSTLTWILYFLCKHEDVKRKLFAEVDDFNKDHPQMTDVLTDKNKLKYLDAVIKETMRLVPAAPYLGRKSTVDVQFSLENSKKITIPAHANVIVLAQYLHSREKYFENADNFVPERFYNDQQVEIAAIFSAYIPFSAGSRACIGGKYAMLQMKLAMVSLMKKYDFSFANEKTTLQPNHHMVQGPARFAIKFSYRK